MELRRLEIQEVTKPAGSALILEPWSTEPEGSDVVYDLAWSTEGWLAGAVGHGVAIWDPEAGKLAKLLEGHSNPLFGLALRPADDLLAALGPSDLTLWRTDTWELLWQDESHRSGSVFGIGFSPSEPLLAVPSGYQEDIDVLRIDVASLISAASVGSVRYTTAKIVLVGDSGVGKTGLGYRLATGGYREGEPETALPPLLRGKVRVDVRHERAYLPAMFDLLLTLHRIDHHDEAVADLRRAIGAGDGN